MIDTMFYINVAELMGVNKPLPKPRLKCTLLDSRAETLTELVIITKNRGYTISAIDMHR